MQQRNTVTFHLSVEPRSGRTEYVSARVVTPLGREFHAGYHPNIGTDGQRDGLSFGRDSESIWLEDRNSGDTFCSELFASLTGRYRYPNEAPIDEDDVFAAAMEIDEEASS